MVEDKLEVAMTEIIKADRSEQQSAK